MVPPFIAKAQQQMLVNMFWLRQPFHSEILFAMLHVYRCWTCHFHVLATISLVWCLINSYTPFPGAQMPFLERSVQQRRYGSDSIHGQCVDREDLSKQNSRTQQLFGCHSSHAQLRTVVFPTFEESPYTTLPLITVIFATRFLVGFLRLCLL